MMQEDIRRMSKTIKNLKKSLKKKTYQAEAWREYAKIVMENAIKDRNEIKKWKAEADRLESEVKLWKAKCESLITDNCDLQPAHQALYHLLKKQSDKGLEKYGRPVEPEALTKEEWMDHLSEELADALVYVTMLKQKEGMRTDV